MTVPATPDPVHAATGADTNAAAHNAADDADKHTPPAVVTPPPEHETEPTNSDGLTELRETVGSLATSVAALTDLVTGKLNPDSSPTDKLPWALRGKRPL